jgi:hypothetical protein
MSVTDVEQAADVNAETDSVDEVGRRLGTHVAPAETPGDPVPPGEDGKVERLRFWTPFDLRRLPPLVAR